MFNLLVTHQEQLVCLLFKGYITELTYGRALSTFIITSVERLIRLFEHTNFSSTHLFLFGEYTFPIKSETLFFIHSIRNERASHCSCSQLIHTCLQRSISFSEGDIFCDG